MPGWVRVQNSPSVPLTELGGEYQGIATGLYGPGRNTPYRDQTALVLRRAQEIRPLDAAGRPSPDGKVVLLSIGQSTTAFHFQAFQNIVQADRRVNPRLVAVNGASDAMVAQEWAYGQRAWGTAASRLLAAGVSTRQVQVVWLKVAISYPHQFGSPLDAARRLADAMTTILQRAQAAYPNLKVAYITPRIYAGYAVRSASPEPYAYASGFGVRWLINRQRHRSPGLNADPTRGPVEAPALLWGPYVWADGARPNPDGFAWYPQDYRPDGVHPSASGSVKVAVALLDYLRKEPSARPWFLASTAHTNRLAALRPDRLG
jgi:hypothetical protein